MVIGPKDVMPLLNRVFEHSYGRPANNRNATSDRGWSPTNCKLQSHPELKQDVPSETSPTNHTMDAPTATTTRPVNLQPADLNLDCKHSAEVLERILQYQMQTDGRVPDTWYLDRADKQRRIIFIIRLACTGRRSRNNTIEALEFGMSVIIFLAFWPKYSSHRRCSPSHYLLFPTMTINLIPRRLLHQFNSICGSFTTVYSSYSLESAYQNKPQNI